MSKQKPKIEHPDFLLIPWQVFSHPDLNANDWMLYAVIYWYHGFKEGRCYAANTTLGKVIGRSGASISNSLTRLERAGMIERVFNDADKRKRATIVPLFRAGGFNAQVEGGSTGALRGVQRTGEQIENIKIENIKTNTAVEFSSDLPKEHQEPLKDDDRTWLQRICSLYQRLWKIEYGSKPVGLHYAKLQKQLEPIVSELGEWQTADALIMYIYDDEPFLVENKHPLHLFPRKVSGLRAEMQNQHRYDLLDKAAIAARITKALSYEQD